MAIGAYIKILVKTGWVTKLLAKSHVVDDENDFELLCDSAKGDLAMQSYFIYFHLMCILRAFFVHFILYCCVLFIIEVTFFRDENSNRFCVFF